MVIGFITSEYPYIENTQAIGGIGTFTKNIAVQLTKRRHQVFVFVHNQAVSNTFVEEGITIVLVKKYSKKGFTWLTNRLYFNQTVNSWIKKEQIQMLEAPEWTGFTAFMRFKCPLLLRLHGSDTYFCNLENRPLKKKNYLFEKAALQGAHKIVGVSNFVAEKTQQLFKLQQAIPVIHNAVDIHQLKPNHAVIKPQSILYFGTLIRKKGVLSIAKMLNELYYLNPDFEMIFIGRDAVDYFTNMSTKDLIIKTLNQEVLKNVSFTSAIPYHEIQYQLQTAQVVVLPSFAEAFPMTWLEAMAMEKAMVTSNIGWAKELMVDGETGYMVNPNDAAFFAQKVNELLMDSTKNISMGKSARKRIQHFFDWQEMVLKNENVYQSLIK